MSNEDLKKVQEELNEEIKKNNEKIDICDEKVKVVKANKFGYKTLKTLGLSFLGYLALQFLFIGSIDFGILGPSTLSNIPAPIIPAFLIGVPLGITTIGQILSNKKNKIKENLEDFSNAKTEQEKLEEEIKCEIELKKAENRNMAIEQAKDFLSQNHSIKNLLSDRFDILDKNLPLTKEEAQKNVETMDIVLREKYDELDILSTKNVLHDLSTTVRTENDNNIDIILTSIIVGCVISGLPTIPLTAVCMVLQNNAPYLSSIITSLIFSVASGIGFGEYMVKDRKNVKKTFLNLNSELKENALPDVIENTLEEKQAIDAQIKRKIMETSVAIIRLQEQKRLLESFTDSEDAKEQDLEKSKSKTIEDIKNADNNIEFNNPMPLYDGSLNKLIVDEDKNSTIEEQGPKLVKRKEQDK